jgi:hypothetical protein
MAATVSSSSSYASIHCIDDTGTSNLWGGIILFVAPLAAGPPHGPGHGIMDILHYSGPISGANFKSGQ